MRRVDLALVPIENALEGSVDVTLDTLAADAAAVAIVGEIVQPVRNSLIAATAIPLESITTVHSHPQPTGQCARFLRERLPRARIVAASSTAEAVRAVVARGLPGEAALGNRLAAELYGAQVLIADVDDEPGNSRASCGSREKNERASCAPSSSAAHGARPRSSSGAQGTRPRAGSSPASPSCRRERST